jgi:prepilin-type N-terminal cleavage/methylation domain-containing protein
VSSAPAPAVRFRRRDGFTLIEITTVVLVIGVLLIIGIPAFLGAKAKANDRSAQVSIRQAFSNAKTILADTDSYADVTPTSLARAETSLRFTTGDSDGPGEVSVDGRSAGLVLAARSKSGICFALGDADNGAGTVFQNLGPFAPCRASEVRSVSPLPGSTPATESATPAGGWARGF